MKDAFPIVATMFASVPGIKVERLMTWDATCTTGTETPKARIEIEDGAKAKEIRKKLEEMGLTVREVPNFSDHVIATVFYVEPTE
jgi:hypothetical protein